MSLFNRAYFGNNFGLDLTSPDLSADREKTRALVTKNVVSRKTSGIEKRKGFQVKEIDKGGFGVFNYIKKNTDGTVTEELLTVDENLWRVKEGTLNVTYTGSSSSARIIVENNGTTEIRALVYEGTTLQTTEALGVGYDETSTVTMATLSTNIAAISGDFASTVTGTSTTPAAFLNITAELIIPSGTTGTITFFYFEQVNTPLTDPLTTYVGKQGNAEFLNVSGVNHKNVHYFAFGEGLHKYDAQTFYLAGMPQPANTVVQTRVGSGTLTGAYVYGFTYIHTDNQNNTVESAMREIASITLAAENMSLEIPSVVDSTGYATGCAIADGAQTVAVSGTTVTLVVDDGTAGAHTLKAGDTAYLFNRNLATPAYRTYVVSSATRPHTSLDNSVSGLRHASKIESLCIIFM